MSLLLVQFAMLDPASSASEPIGVSEAGYSRSGSSLVASMVEKDKGVWSSVVFRCVDDYSFFSILFYFRTFSVNSKARGQGFLKRLYGKHKLGKKMIYFFVDVMFGSKLPPPCCPSSDIQFSNVL